MLHSYNADEQTKLLYSLDVRDSLGVVYNPVTP